MVPRPTIGPVGAVGAVGAVGPVSHRCSQRGRHRTLGYRTLGHRTLGHRTLGWATVPVRPSRSSRSALSCGPPTRPSQPFHPTTVQPLCESVPTSSRAGWGSRPAAVVPVATGGRRGSSLSVDGPATGVLTALMPYTGWFRVEYDRPKSDVRGAERCAARRDEATGRFGGGDGDRGRPSAGAVKPHEGVRLRAGTTTLNYHLTYGFFCIKWTSRFTGEGGSGSLCSDFARFCLRAGHLHPKQRGRG